MNFLLGFFLLSQISFAVQKKVVPFQKVLNECFKEEFSDEKISSLNEVYAVLEKKYTLQSSTILEREVIFKTNSQNRKLKYANDRWTLYKVLENDVLEALNSGMRQKNQTAEMMLSQQLIHADIQSDWVKTKESRVGERTVTLSRKNGRLEELRFQKAGQKNSLECKPQQTIDICSCRESK